MSLHPLLLEVCFEVKRLVTYLVQCTDTHAGTHSQVCALCCEGGVAGNLASVIVMPERVSVTRVVGPRH